MQCINGWSLDECLVISSFLYRQQKSLNRMAL